MEDTLTKIVVVALKLHLPPELACAAKEVKMTIHPRGAIDFGRSAGLRRSNTLHLAVNDKSCLFMLHGSVRDASTLYVSVYVEPNEETEGAAKIVPRYLGVATREIPAGEKAVHLDVTICDFEPYAVYRAASNF